MILDYYVYVLMDSSKPGKYIYDEYEFNYEPFYIGKGRNNRIKDTFYDKSPFKYNKIKKLKENNIDIISLKIVENISNNDAMNLEIKLITLIGRRDDNKGTLVNQTDGGDGRSNSKQTEETKNKISKNRKGKGIGWKHKKETLFIMSKNQTGEGNGFYGKFHTDDVKIDQSKRVSGDKHPMYGKKHNKSTISILKDHRKNNISNTKIKETCQVFNKKVLMYDLSMNFIKEFISVKEASIETDINESIISKCCRGDIKSPTRFYFKYKNEEDKIKNNKYLISIGEYFIFNGIKYKLIKRNKKTCICENREIEYTIHVNDFKFLFEKDTNDSDMIELYLLLKSYDKNFKIKDNIIYNNYLYIKYLKLINNSEIFKQKNDIIDDNFLIIFEDEWINKKEIVISRLLNKLNKSNKIFARKCEVREILDNKLIRNFLNRNHIQGFVGSKIKIGLFYGNELVSLMTFGDLRKNLGQSSVQNKYEMLRFCNKLNYNVIGGASRMVNYFIKNYKPSYILSYSDRRWGNGNLYKKIGFKLSNSIIYPNYFYIINNKREGRFKYRKDILIKNGFDKKMTEIDIMHKRGYYRIFDNGSLKFEMFL